MKRVSWFLVLSLFIFHVCASLAVAQTANADLNAAMTLHAAGKAADALPIYQRAAQEPGVEVPRALYGAAACLLFLKEYSAALDQFNQIAQNYPKTCFAGLSLCHAGNCVLESGGSLSDAEHYYSGALQLDESQGDQETYLGWANLGMGKVRFGQGRYTEASAYLEQAIAQAPETCVSNGAFDLLNQCLAALNSSGQSSTANAMSGAVSLAAGRRHCKDGSLWEALPYLQDACSKLRDGNELSDACFATGECLLALKHQNEAVAYFQAIQGVQDKSPAYLAKRADWVSKAAERMADVFLHVDDRKSGVAAATIITVDRDAGIKALKRFITEYPTDPKADDARVSVGDDLTAQGRSDEAKAWYNQLAAEDPANCLTWKLRLSLSNEKDHKAAQKLLRMIVDGLRGKSGQGYLDMASKLIALGHKREAVPVLEQMPVTTDGILTARRNILLGQQLADTRRYEEALAMFQAVRQIDDPSPAFQNNRADFLGNAAIDEAIILAVQGHAAEGVRLCDQTLELCRKEGGDWRLLKRARITCLVAVGQLDRADQEIRDYLREKTDPQEKAGLLTQLAEAYRGAKRYRESIRAANEIRDLRGASAELKAEAVYCSGLSYRDIGYDQSAQECMSLIVRRYPDSSWARKARGMLYVWSNFGPNPAAGQQGQPTESQDTSVPVP